MKPQDRDLKLVVELGTSPNSLYVPNHPERSNTHKLTPPSTTTTAPHYTPQRQSVVTLCRLATHAVATRPTEDDGSNPAAKPTPRDYKLRTALELGQSVTRNPLSPSLDLRSLLSPLRPLPSLHHTNSPHRTVRGTPPRKSWHSSATDPGHHSQPGSRAGR